MQKLAFFFLLLAFSACEKSNPDGHYPPCIQQKIEDFIEKESSWSVQWVNFKGEAFYKFSGAGEDVYFDERCKEVCRYAYISSFLPECKLELDGAGGWTTIWEK